jgi:uncharacterized protein YbgA (DUF1722 family)
MARSRRRKGGAMRKLLLVAVIAFVVYIAVHTRAYLADQQYLQHYIDTHTTAPATPGR